MQYKLIKGSKNDTNDVIGTVLQNRGIQNWEQYINLDASVVQDYNDLNNMKEAVECFIKHYENHDKIMIMPDEDCDGFTSSAMLYMYIKSLDKTYPIDYILHDHPKQHGLTEIDLDNFKDAKLVIIADASTNDAFQCNQLIARGTDVIVLDHHDQDYIDEDENEFYNPIEIINNAIIVNNQLSPQYKNKNLSGAGIVYRFLQAIDEELWEEYADNFLDLCALGNIADVMDMRSLETRYLVNKGIASINNKFLQSLAHAQEYSTKGIINIHNIAWYFAPVCNAVTRMGNKEERELVFRAMIEQYEEFDYKKRDGSIIVENIYDRAVRIAKNIKSRQDKQRDIVFNELKDLVNLNEPIIILESHKAQNGLIGLSCMKLADTFKKCTIIVKKIEKDGSPLLVGSCRNFTDSPVSNLKELILKTEAFEFCRGHGNAAGLAILPENLDLAKKRFKELLFTVDFNTSILCDFVIDIDDLAVSFIQDIDSAKWIWCTGVKEPIVAVENICLLKKDITLQGKNCDSITFEINNIKFVQFKLKEGDPLYDFVNSWTVEDDDEIEFNAVGTCSINNYGGALTPQFVISDVQTIQNYSMEE